MTVDPEMIAATAWLIILAIGTLLWIILNTHMDRPKRPRRPEDTDRS